MSGQLWSDGNGAGSSSTWNWTRTEPPAQRPPLKPELGLLRGQYGSLLLVEVSAEGGGTVLVEAPAIFHLAYQLGDRVLVLFLADEANSAVVLGRVGELTDIVTGDLVLGLILGVDGGGSGLDADLLDGQHESALLRADGSRPLSGDWDTGAGRVVKTEQIHARAIEGLDLCDRSGTPGLFVEEGGQVAVGHRVPVCALHVKAPADGMVGYFAADDGADSAGVAIYAYTDDYGTAYLANTAVVYAPSTTAALVLAAAAAGADLRFVTGGAPAASTERMRLTATGLGIGTSAPQGKLHLWDGTGGLLVTTRSAIGATAQALIPAGTGDVGALVRVEAIVSNGTATVFEAFTLAGVASYTVTAGSESYQFRRNADGSLDVRRTAGSAAGTAVVRAMWL